MSLDVPIKAPATEALTDAADVVRIVPFSDLSESIWDMGAMAITNPMQDQAWVKAAVDVYCHGDADVLIVGPPQAPDGLAILCPSVDLGGGLRNLGDSVMSEATALIARDPAALTALAEGFASVGRAVNFGHYPTQDGLPDALRKALRARGLVMTKPSPQRAWPSLSLTQGWDALETGMSRSRRQTLNRKWRKAEQLGPLRVEVLTPTPDQTNALMDVAFAVQARSWKGDAGTALSDTPEHAAFFRNFARRAAALGQLRICFLHIGDQVAAMQIATDWRARFWSISIGYDEGFGAVSPGELLTRELIRRACAQGYQSFEFCGKEADWTLKWTDDATEVESLRIYPLSVSGLTTLGGQAMRKIANRLAR